MTCVTLCNMYINSCLIESCTDCLFFSPLRRLFHYLLDFGALGHIVDCYLPIILRTGPGPTAVSRGLKTAWGSQQNLRPYKRRGSPVRSGEIRWPHWAMAMLGESRTNSSLMFFTWQNKYCNIYIWNYMNHNFLCQILSLLMSLVWVFTKRIIVPRGHVSSPVKLFNLGPLWGISPIGPGVVVMKSPCLGHVFCFWCSTTRVFSLRSRDIGKGQRHHFLRRNHGKHMGNQADSPSGFLHVSLLDCLAS
jgi:hypothetical protein